MRTDPPTPNSLEQPTVGTKSPSVPMLKRWGFHGGDLLIQMLESVSCGQYRIQAQVNGLGEIQEWDVGGGPAKELSLPMSGVAAGDGVRVKITNDKGEWDTGWFRVQAEQCPHCGKSLYRK